VFFSHAKSVWPPTKQPASSVFLPRQIRPATGHQPAERGDGQRGFRPLRRARARCC
jgi:hypothetical protein